ncbi:ferric reductase-like transmembrane domain-containing protein [Microbulbifer agarilyticus]|uniref:ferric reductase-like transmembrane domain-containing protein n=1 Tax=Microbulbifer agarilyticus TaxID=260552 RepID=UPI001CD6CED7|nr:ferric reductase-like transmembrane domain-containing protein [Microbulbifer agarilyticus]MCA0891825.1 EF-hand domain-containing protein [Microbulbifer agarilyticus]
MSWPSNRLIKRAYRKLAGHDELIDYSDWKKALSVDSDFLARRMFSVIDTDHSGYIDYDEFREFVLALKGNDRIAFLFNCYDVDNDGKLTREELRSILSTSLSEQDLALSEDTLDEMVQSVLDAAKVKKHSINVRDLAVLFEHFPDLTLQLDHFLRQLLGQNLQRKKSHRPIADFGKRVNAAMHVSLIPHLWLLVYLAANVYLFASAMTSYAMEGASLAVQIARGGGACLNLNAALVLIPILRSILTLLRHNILHRLLPLDRLTDAHRLFGFAIILFSGIHISAHIVNYVQANQPLLENLFSTTVGLTGVAISACLLLMWRSAQRRKTDYERFVLTHLLYAPFIVAILIHAPNFWLWFTPVAILLLIDALIRFFFRYKRVEITDLKPLSERVTQVKFKRGKHFKFVPGDYIRIRIPAISRWEWHPFTLSAAPESNRIDIHVRHAGNWTAALNNLANKRHKGRQKWTAYIDGPYAAPTSGFYRAPVAVLIAGGIGVTPFASVIHSFLKSARTTPNRLYFHWLNRSQRSYSWFIDLIHQAEAKLGNSRFNATIHLTRLRLNLSNLLLQIAFNAYWGNHKKDALTGLQARTQTGRPDWSQVFSKLRDEHPKTPVHIYFCGPKPLGKELRKEALRQGLLFHEEQFE